MIGDQGYPTLEAAFAAVADGQTIELLDNVELTEAQTLNLNNLEGTGITLDLGKFKLTTTAALTIANTKMTIANGEITVPTASGLVFKTNSDVTLAADGVIRPTATYAFEVEDATFNVYGTCTANVQVPIHAKVDGGVINIYDGAVVENTNDDFDAIRMNGGETEDCTVTLNVYGGTITGAYSIYAYKPNNKSIINIEGGVFNNILVIRRDSQVQVTPLDDTCTAKFKVVGKHESMDNLLVSELCAPGYGPVLGDDGFYMIQKLYKVEFAQVENGTLETSVTNNIVAGTTVTVYAKPADGYKVKSVKAGELDITAAMSFEMPAKDVEITAEFEQDAQPLDPEQPTEPFDTDEQAKKAAAAMNDGGHVKTASINVPEAAGTEQADKDAYAALFVAVAKADKTVEIELNEAGTNALKAATAAIETAVANKLGDITAAAEGATLDFGTVTENVKPGFWYGVAVTTELGNMKTTNPETWVQATKAGVKLTATKPEGNAAFFQTKAKATNK